MDNEELRRYLQWMNNEYGDRGWEGQGQMSLDDYGSESLSGREGWSDIIRDQLRTNQFGDQSLNQSFAEKDLPSGLGLLSNREDAEQVLRSRLVDNPDYPHIKMTPTPTDMMSRDGVPRGPQLGEPNLGFASTVHAPQKQALESSSSFPYQQATRSFTPIGPAGSGAGSASYSSSPLGPVGSDVSVDAMAGSGGEGALAAEEGLLALEAGESAWGGPATIAGNMALSAIPTRDKKKTKTPFGEEGSASGILKGTGKGALLGATIGSAFPVIGVPVGAAVGGTVGFIGGSQGYFDSTSAPTLTMSGIRRRGGGGMQGGLLGGGSMYG